MTLIRHRGAEPEVDPTAYVAPNATLVGAVTVGPRARVMFGAVIHAEGSRIEVGDCSIVCEQAVLRATAVGDVDHPGLVGDYVGEDASLFTRSAETVETRPRRHSRRCEQGVSDARIPANRGSARWSVMKRPLRLFAEAEHLVALRSEGLESRPDGEPTTRRKLLPSRASVGYGDKDVQMLIGQLVLSVGGGSPHATYGLPGRGPYTELTS
ncbi:MAG: gamma carbonic anhydrase family protein [Solirubrobacterales bacterium]